MRRIVLSDIDLTIRQQELSLAMMVVGIRVNKAAPRDKGRASHSPLVFVVGQYPPDLIRSGVGGCRFIVGCCQSRAQRLGRSISPRRVHPLQSDTLSAVARRLGATPAIKKFTYCCNLICRSEPDRRVTDFGTYKESRKCRGSAGRWAHGEATRRVRPAWSNVEWHETRRRAP
jgi:hypothetical protein